MLIRLDRDRLFRWLFAGILIAEVAIVLLDALISESGWVSIGAARRLFNITREDGVANFFSSFQALAVAGILLVITMVVRGQTRGTASRTYVGRGVISGLFIFLGIDDGTEVEVRSRQGVVKAPAKLSKAIPEGVVHLADGIPEAASAALNRGAPDGTAVHVIKAGS